VESNLENVVARQYHKQHDSKPNQTFNNLKMNIINIKDIILVNWNANGLKSKRSTLAEFLSRNKIDIAGITETHLKDSETFKIPGYEIYRNDRKHTHSSGGVAILIKKNLKHNPIILPPKIQMEAVAINLVTDKHDLRVISSYNPPNKKIQNSDLPKLFNNTPTILLGDLNSKNTIWGCKKTNPNGHKLYEYMSDLNILVSPPPGPTFYRTGVTPDILDIMLISNFPTNLYHKVLNELDSDHVPVLTSLKIQAEANPPIQKLINRLIKWEIFKENIDKILKPYRKYTNTNDINSGIIHLTESIKSAIDLALAPPKNKKPHMNSTPIPSHIQNLIKEKHKARRIWQIHRSPAVKKRLNQLTRRVKWELDNLRYNSYKEYVSNINPNDSSLWIATKRITKQRETIPPLKNGLAKYETNTEKCEIFTQHFEDCFTTEENHTNQNEVVNHKQSNLGDQPVGNPINPCTPNEIHQIINKLAKKKAQDTT